MFADPKKARLRKLKRTLKAGASIVVAMAAGAFLACQKEEIRPDRSPEGPDARTGPMPQSSASDSPSGGPSSEPAPTASASAQTSVPEGPGKDELDAGAPDADSGAADGGKKPVVDKKEHRKGMPVRDNLLE